MRRHATLAIFLSLLCRHTYAPKVLLLTSKHTRLDAPSASQPRDQRKTTMSSIGREGPLPGLGGVTATFVPRERKPGLPTNRERVQREHRGTDDGEAHSGLVWVGY